MERLTLLVLLSFLPCICAHADDPNASSTVYHEFSLKTPTGREIQFKGTTNCTDRLITDMLAGIVGYSGGEDNITDIRPKFIAWEQQGKYWQEEWIVETKDSNNKTFAITLTPTSDGGADYQITPK